MVAGIGDKAEKFIEAFNRKFEFRTVSYRPRKFRFFGITTIQNESFSIDTNADEKLEDFSEYSLSRHRRKKGDKAINDLEKSVFPSANSSLG